jgi:hypothetical protein
MNDGPGVTTAAKPVKPRRPRPDGLTYTFSELCWALGMSARQLRRKRHLLPAALPWSRRPLWSRTAIIEWLENGGTKRR